MLINKRESTGLTHLNDSKAFTEYSNDMGEIYKNIEEYNPNKERKTLIVFDDLKKKIKHFSFFITQYYFAVPKNIRLNSKLYFIINIPNERELHQISYNHSSYIDFKNIMNLYKKMYCKTTFFLMIGTTLASANLLRFRPNLLKII